MRSLQTLRLALHTLSLFFLLIAVAAIKPSDALAQAATAGSVTSVSGTVQLQRGAATIPVTQGILVEVGDRIITGDDGHVVVLLTDQSTLDLGDSSNIVIDQHQGATTRVSVIGGVVRSFVNRTIGAAAPNFEVHTPNAVAAARGTLFDTSYREGISRPTYGDTHNFTDVSVYDGLVNAANVNNPAGGIDIPAGYESTVAGTMNPTTPGPLGMTGATSLKSGGARSIAAAAVLSPVSTVPPPACPVCPSISTGGTIPPPSVH